MAAPPGITIGPATHGQGAFASRAFAKGALLGHYTGEVLGAAEAAARADQSDMYVLREKPRAVIDAIDASKSSWARFINSPRGSMRHANVRWGRHIYGAGGSAAVEVRVLRAIRVGDELLVGYGRSYVW